MRHIWPISIIYVSWHTVTYNDNFGDPMIRAVFDRGFTSGGGAYSMFTWWLSCQNWVGDIREGEGEGNQQIHIALHWWPCHMLLSSRPTFLPNVSLLYSYSVQWNSVCLVKFFLMFSEMQLSTQQWLDYWFENMPIVTNNFGKFSTYYLIAHTLWVTRSKMLFVN